MLIIDYLYLEISPSGWVLVCIQFPRQYEAWEGPLTGRRREIFPLDALYITEEYA